MPRAEIDDGDGGGGGGVGSARGIELVSRSVAKGRVLVRGRAGGVLG